MNEVKFSSQSPVVVGAASSAGSAERGAPVGTVVGSKSTETSAPVETAPEFEVAVADEATINQAVADLNAYAQNEQRDLMFSVDERSGDMVVRVLDRDSGDLIRQIPNEVVIDLAAKARDNEGLQLVNMHG